MLNFTKLRVLGIDTDEGLAYCADDAEFYGEMLEEYVSEVGKRLDDLPSHFSSHDWKAYGILAQSIKSSSRMIGAKALSELARELEMATREGAEDTILSGHDRFLTEYRDLAERIRECIR